MQVLVFSFDSEANVWLFSFFPKSEPFNVCLCAKLLFISVKMVNMS